MCRHRSPATAIACVALFFSLGGAGLAAVRQASHARSASVQIVTVQGPIATMCARRATFQKCNLAGSAAACPKGTQPVGGGWDLPGASKDNYAYDASVISNAPPPGGGGWIVEMVNNDATLSGSFRAVAVCDMSGQ